MLLVVLVAGGVAVEYTRMRLTRVELQAAADNCARSAATELVLTDSKSEARDRALDIASRYRVANQPFSISPDDVVFGRTNNGSGFVANQDPPNAVRVVSRRAAGSAAGPLNMIFGSMFGVQNTNLHRDATAGFRLVDICLVLDRSSSMKKSNAEFGGLSMSDPRASLPPDSKSRWKNLEDAFNRFLNSLENNAADEKVAMVTFASDFTAFGITSQAATIDFDLSSDLPAAVAAMDSLSNSVWNGNTHVEAGMRKGMEVLTSSPGLRENSDKIMIVLTDGYENEGDARSAAVDVAAAGIIIHTISFGHLADREMMQDVAEIGNGQFAHAQNAQALMSIMQDLAASLTTLLE
jgi:Mg-chelatase subunit ChlD